MLALLAGGPADGTLLQLPDDTTVWTIPQLADRLDWYSHAGVPRPVQLDTVTYRLDSRMRADYRHGYAHVFFCEPRTT